MLTLLLASAAFAADPADGLAAAEITAEKGLVVGSGTWSQVPDNQAVEMALVRAQVAAEAAVVVSVAPSTGGRDQERVQISRFDLGKNKSSRMVEGSRRVCANNYVDLWDAGSEIRVYTAEEIAPGIVFVQDHATVGALVGIAPGEQVTVRGVRVGGELVKESVTVERASGALVLKHTRRREQICYEPGV